MLVQTNNEAYSNSGLFVHIIGTDTYGRRIIIPHGKGTSLRLEEVDHIPPHEDDVLREMDSLLQEIPLRELLTLCATNPQALLDRLDALRAQATESLTIYAQSSQSEQ